MKLKDIALSAAYVGQRVVKAICVGAQEVWSAVKYIVFKDPLVEQICVANFSSDGIGVTEEDAAKVTSIGTLFKGNTEITSFDELEKFDRVTSIPDGSFSGCTSLTSIGLPPSATSIGTNAFKGDTSLTKVITPNVEYTLGHFTFQNCASLEYIDLSNMTRTGEQTFASTTNLKKTIILNKINYIGFFAFQNSGLLELYINSTGITAVSGSAFISCPNLKKVRLSKTIQHVDGFEQCPKLSDINIIDNRSLKYIKFNKVPLEFEDVRMPNIRTLAGNSSNVQIYSYTGCVRMSDIGTLSGALAQSFQDNSNLEYIVIPYGVTSLLYTLYRCNKSKTIIMNPIVPPAISNIANDLGTVGAVYVPDESVDAYSNTTTWSSIVGKIHPMSSYVTYEDISSNLVNDIVYETPAEAWDKFEGTPIAEVGAKSLICDVAEYGFAKIKGNGGTSSRLYCFLDDNDEVVTTSEESLNGPLYIVIPKIATKMVVNLSASSTEFEVKIGKHIE